MDKNTNGELTDEEIRRMSPIEANVYAEEHPEEVMHITRVFFVSAVKQTKKALAICLTLIRNTKTQDF